MMMMGCRHCHAAATPTPTSPRRTSSSSCWHHYCQHHYYYSHRRHRLPNHRGDKERGMRTMNAKSRTTAILYCMAAILTSSLCSIGIGWCTAATTITSTRERHRHHRDRRKLNGLLPEAPPISPFRVGRINNSSLSSSSSSSKMPIPSNNDDASIATPSTNDAINTIDNANNNTNTRISSSSSVMITNIHHHDTATQLEASSSDHQHQQSQQQEQEQQEQQHPLFQPTSEYDRDPAIQYGSSLYNSNSNNNNHVNSSNSSSNNNSKSNNNRNIRGGGNNNNDNNSENNSNNAWAPEDYPDPWTNPNLCGGAASTTSTSDSTSYSSSYSLGGVGGGDDDNNNKNLLLLQRTLFCDPDQVLDANTYRSVALKLREFASAFALSAANSIMDITEGIEFGGGSSGGAATTTDEGGGGGGAIAGDVGAVIKQDIPPRDDATRTHDDYEGQHVPSPTENDALDHSSRVLAASDAVGGTFSTMTNESSGGDGGDGGGEKQKIEIAIALVKKIDLPAILRADSYFYYSDQDDMVNDAAQYFARYIHDNWSRYLAREQNSSSVNIVLIFISTLDRICYISSGNRLAAVLPWWRLEHVVQDMKQDLQKRQIGDAIVIAIDDLTSLLIGGPPSFRDRVNDFLQRFGIVILFTVFTFTFATLGECRESRRRIFFADRRSRMNATERESARLLQKVFRTKSCPICLEPFEPDITTIDMEQSLDKHRQKHKRIDSYGIPLLGTDDKPIKLLRCGHIFDMTCWQMWVDSGQGNVLFCPVCRQDVGASKRESSTSHRRGYTVRYGGRGAVSADEFGRAEEGRNAEQSSLFARIIATTSGPSMLLRPVNNTTRQNYNAIPTRSDPLPTRVMIDRQRSAPTIMQLSMHSILGEPTTEIDEISTEQTPFLLHVSSGDRRVNYY